MFRKRKLIRAVAIFFILQILFDVTYPTISYALTAGPTSPEATSFEPVDTTDMVNLATGDFVYNIPLLEVPGPSGGYPLSLSYHAGINPNQDASWVGLGWTLNPGAINRMVNGFPDDHNNAVRTTRDYWAGGSTNTFSSGVGVCGATFNLDIATDTYRGLGVGTSVSYGYGIGPASASVGVGIRPYGGISATASMGLSVYGLAGGGVSTDFKSVSAYGQIGNSMLGISMSSNDTKPQLSVAGVSMQLNNVYAGEITSKTSGFGVVIPLGYITISLAHRYHRYYSDESYDFNSSGVLHSPDMTTDSYSLHDPAKFVENIAESNPNNEAGGAFPSYDSYAVLGQGIGGTMSPYIFGNGSTGRVTQFASDIKYDANIGNLGPQISFRFHNEFSNSLTYDDPQIEFSPYNEIFGNNLKYINDQPNVKAEGFNEFHQQLPGSKNVEWYTVRDVVEGKAEADGLLLHSTSEITKTMSLEYLNKDGVLSQGTFDIQDQIGAYKVTNNSGVSYHYAQPVYTNAEYTEINNYSKKTWRREINPQPYAYTWLLTAVTGPDYKDRNNNGMPDEGDWGYWVSFNYGKWADEYVWRNPALDERKDIDPDVHQYSIGKKELYYLNTIKTASHTAVFEKKWRSDGKGIVDYKRSPTGSFEAYSVPCGYLPADYKVPVSPLRLDKIYLFTNEDYEALGGDNINGDEPAGSVCQPYKMFEWNVIDHTDITTSFSEKAIRTIGMGYSYDLQPNTENSYFVFGRDPDVPDSYGDQIVPSLNGKLTLESLKFFGKSGADIIPPTIFKYDEEENLNVDLSGTVIGDKNNKLKVGDIITFSSGQQQYYGLIAKHKYSLGYPFFDIKFLTEEYSSAGVENINCKRTKNPPYNKDAYDIWGMYKPDYDPSVSNENLSRMVTDISSRSVDVWSLRKISSPLGADIKIKYESDDYGNAVLYDNNSLIINELSVDANGEYTFSFSQLNDNLKSVFVVGQYVNFTILYKKTGVGPRGAYFDGYSAINSADLDRKPIITEVGQNYIKVLSVELRNIADNTYPKLPSGSTIANSIGGNVSFGNVINKMGGGIRVKELTADNNGDIQKTVYSYDLERHSSGITSYEPVGLDIHKDFGDAPYGYTDPDEIFKKALYKDFSELLFNSREIPPPGVVYKEVKVEQYNNNLKLPGHVIHRFETFEEDQVGVNRYNHYEEANHEFKGITDYAFSSQTVYADVERRSIRFRNFTNRIGNLKSTIYYDDKGFPISSLENKYLHDAKDGDEYLDALQEFKNQGVVHQLFNEYRIIDQPESSLKKHLALSSLREEYPAILLKQVETNYKTGLSKSTENLAFDFYSGQVTKSLYRDSYGNSIITETEPAYKKYPAMGLSINHGLNMLTQTAGSKSYTMGLVHPESLISANVQTWSSQIPVLRGKALRTATIRYFDQDTGDRKYKINDLDNKLELGDIIVFNYKTVDVEVAYKAKVVFEFNSTTYLIKFAEWVPLINGTATSIDVDAQVISPYRKHRSFAYKGDDIELESIDDNLYPYSSFTEFDAWNHEEVPFSDQWQKNSEITLYDTYSHALEAKDVNGNYAATKMDVDQEQVYSTVANARYHEYGYTGFEKMSNSYRFSGGIQLGVGDANLGSEANGYHVHTGNVGVRVTLDGGYACLYDFPSNVDRSKTYRVSVWVHKDKKDQLELYAKDGSGYIKTFTGAELSESKKAGDWYLASMDVPLQGTTGTIQFGVASSGGTGLSIDDFRFHPIDATMTSYVYNKWGELSHILDANNLYTHFKYDGMGKLKSTHKESFDHGEVKVSEVNYGYALNHLANANNLSALGIETDGVIKVGNSERFSATGINSYGMSYRWDFEDGITSTSSSPSITFNEVGSRWVTLKVTDSKGYYNEVAKLITVRDCPRAGTIKSRVCLLSQPQCYSGVVRVTYHDGDCDTYYVDEDASGDECSNNGDCS